MITRVMRSGVWIVLSALLLTGCGRPAARESARDLSLLAIGPDRSGWPVPAPFVTAAFNAAGGLAAWEQCRQVEFRATVTACEGDGCFYLTEHDFTVFPWSNAIQVTAREPRANFIWQVVHSQPRVPQGDPNLDVSPLKDLRGDYAEAVLQIATAPVRMLEDTRGLTPAPATVQITGQWYLPIDVKYRTPIYGGKAKVIESYWTQGTYFQSQNRSLVDMVWLGNPGAQRFVLVRGYDYTGRVGGDVLLPSKIEIFQSDAYANTGPRLALIELRR
jgi:hypothetical protein